MKRGIKGIGEEKNEEDKGEGSRGSRGEGDGERRREESR